MNPLFSRFSTLIIALLFTNTVSAQYDATNQAVSYQPKVILKAMEQVADWQLNTWETKGSKWPMYDWIPAAGYTGIIALGEISKDKKYVNSLVEISRKLNWNTGPRRFYADDYCIGQTYSLLYTKFKDKTMIANWQRLADSIVAQPHDESLEWKNNVRLREWAWCDALFMGPTALSYLATATGEQKYLDMALKLWWKTTDYLYNKEEHLYFRDASYFNKKEPNGKPVFWSRGNGWVMGGMVRVMDNMPAKHPDRPRFEQLYKEMAAKIISLQQADGSWHSSLLDPQSFNIKETSGTGFYCYALTWGINHGLIDKKVGLPIVKKAWAVLASSVKADGMLGYVQPVGASPDKVDENSTEAYGVGAFLLAGSEMYKLMKK